MEKHILFMPDGNRRYAKKENISQAQAYQKGAKSLQLFSDFFLLENDWNQLTMHIMSKYTHERNDMSLKPIYDAMIKEFTHLHDKNYFDKNGIKFQWIDHSNKLPLGVVEICQALEEKTKNGNKISLNLLGYDLETDEKNAYEQSSDYIEFRSNRLISDIDLVIRTTEMRPSKGPVYAMAQSQMLLLQKLNPELERTDLEKILQEYNNLVGYRQKLKPLFFFC